MGDPRNIIKGTDVKKKKKLEKIQITI